MQTADADPVRELESALRLLAARPSLAIPTAVASVVSSALIFFLIGALLFSIVGGALMGHAAGLVAGLGVGAAGTLAAILLILALSWFAHVMVVVAAHDAWLGRTPNFRVAANITIAHVVDLAVAFLAVGALAIVPFVLCFVLVGVPLVAALGFFLMYVTPAIVIGNESGIGAIRTSFRMTLAQPGFSAAGYAGIAAAFVAGRIADAMFVHIPLVGLISAVVIGGATAAYGALVSVRFYELMRGRELALSAPGGSQTALR